MNAWMLPGVCLAWSVACLWLSGRIARALCAGARSLPVQALVFLVLLPLLVIDELLAQPSFEALCRRALAPVAVASPASAAGLARLRVVPPAEPVPGLILPVRVRQEIEVDAATGRPVGALRALRAGGGRLARLLGSGDDTGPLTFQGTCGRWPSG